MGCVMALIVLFLRLMNIIESWYFFALPFAVIEALNGLKLTYYRFSNNSKLALPLVSMQYQEIFIKITFNPIKDLYTILDVENMDMEEGLLV